ncbi:DMT family transporter [Endozoicomonas sp. G2_2]|uniref:DMT family transporter n=1 Tax=Endozoicomonas sp. G2_2 TaxID=2821092 RepID=UPI001ADA4EA7|nr:DMT family transporter [Endozoicomonas sp. G2_2]MBO9471657.1 DMT family transporter [Endozoicomonas sp. G2_2]
MNHDHTTRMKQPSSHSNRINGVVLMAVASLTVPIVDASAKYLSTDISPFFLAWARFAIAAPAFGVFCKLRRGHILFTRDTRDIAAVVPRGLALVIAMTCVFLALRSVPLSTAFGGYFIGPVIATVLARILLDETITRIQSFATALGFLGALLVLQPEIGFSQGELFAALSGLAFGVYLLLTREASKRLGSLDTTLITLLTGSICLFPFALRTWPELTLTSSGLLLEMGLLTAFCQYFVIRALVLAPTAVVAPIAYLELISASLLGFIIFGNLPSTLAIVGLAAIIVSGTILARR